MNTFSIRMIIGASAGLLITTSAFAHAFLDKAVPAVGGTVNVAPAELQIAFSEDIVPAFSGVSVATAGGATVPIGKPTFSPADTMHIKLGRALGAGTYVVTWHVVAVDTHRTSGSYRFTIAP